MMTQEYLDTVLAITQTRKKTRDILKRILVDGETPEEAGAAHGETKSSAEQLVKYFKNTWEYEYLSIINKGGEDAYQEIIKKRDAQKRYKYQNKINKKNKDKT